VSLWPHQAYGVSETLAAIGRGERKICLTSPTGGGKTRMACELIDRWLDEGHKVAVYTNRRLLIEQLSSVLARHGIDHGVRAAGYDGEDNRGWHVQVCSIQTEHSRVFKKGVWQLHDATRVLVDEAHLNKSDMARKILDTHHEEGGAAYVGLTATPIDIGHLYETLIQAGTNSELRACGALVPCVHYGPDEPDLKHCGKLALGQDPTEQENVKAIMVPGVFGRVLDNLLRLNPNLRPTILFAPGVAESVWFAEQFYQAGVSAAHIDGQEVWVNGSYRRSDRQARADILRGSANGDITVLCNRFVLREGIDAPWLSHGIFATVYGSLQSYLQSGGRLLRAAAGIESVQLQDHGGNWWRHGSLNADRTWRLTDTAGSVAADRADQWRTPGPGAPPQPARCPQCSRILMSPRCPCGWSAGAGFRKSRPVIQADGSLQEHYGDPIRAKRTEMRSDTLKHWTAIYWRCFHAKKPMTFRQAEALFYQDHGYWPPRNLPLMPREPGGWRRRVSQTGRELLI
jgi:DNA repair protein RadD